MLQLAFKRVRKSVVNSLILCTFLNELESNYMRFMFSGKCSVRFWYLIIYISYKCKVGRTGNKRRVFYPKKDVLVLCQFLQF